MAPSHYPNQCWNIVNWTLRNKLQWNFNRNYNIFIQENTFESVICKTAAILSRPQYIETGWYCELGEVNFYSADKPFCQQWLFFVKFHWNLYQNKKNPFKKIMCTNAKCCPFILASVCQLVSNLVVYLNWGQVQTRPEVTMISYEGPRHGYSVQNNIVTGKWLCARLWKG